MRTAFIQQLILEARTHPDIFLVVGDLGFSVIEPFAEEFPNRFLNAGVAEQNMTGVAAGLASEGWHVFTYSIANFPTLRCLEQIRNDVAYHQLPVTVVSVGAGLSYGNLGYSHHAVQDIGIMRSLPELTVLSPADPGEARECVRWLSANPCPSYLRIGKAGEPKLHDPEPLRPQPIQVRTGNCNCALIATGSILKCALEASLQLNNEGLNLSVFSCPWLQPVEAENFSALAGLKKLVVIDEHLPAGGLASLLGEFLRETEIVSLALIPEALHHVGSQDYLRQQSKIDAKSIAVSVKALLG